MSRNQEVSNALLNSTHQTTPKLTDHTGWTIISNYKYTGAVCKLAIDDLKEADF